MFVYCFLLCRLSLHLAFHEAEALGAFGDLRAKIPIYFFSASNYRDVFRAFFAKGRIWPKVLFCQAQFLKANIETFV